MTTEGGLLNGRLIYRQPTVGFRSGIEPVLLAACVPAKPDQRVLEAGTGAGAALLCLHARLPGIQSVGVEVDADTAAIAAGNAAANGFGGMAVIAGAIEALRTAGDFDHAIANPPYHGDGTASPVAARELAKRGPALLIHTWVAQLAAHLRDRGSLTMIIPSRMVPGCLAAMTDSGCACSVMFPLWPMAGRDAKLVLVRGVRGSRAPMRLAAGLVLHYPDGSFTEAAQDVLRNGAALELR